MKPYYQDSAVTIYHGDALELLPQFEADSFDMLWADPPYGHNNHDDDLNSRLNSHRGIKDAPIANDGPETMRRFLGQVLSEGARVLKADCCCCCCCCGGGGPKPTFAWVAQRMDSGGLSFFHSVIWDKLNPGLGWRYRRQHEMVMVAHREGGKLRWANDDIAVPNIISMMPPRDRQHPNEKPLKLISAFIGHHCKHGDKVLDPCMGIGTSLRAAKDLGVLSVGIDIEEKYCEIAANRMSQEVLAL